MEDSALDSILDRNGKTLQGIIAASNQQAKLEAAMEPPQDTPQALASAIQQAGVTDVPEIMKFLKKRVDKSRLAAVAKQVLAILSGGTVAAGNSGGRGVAKSKPHDPSRHQPYDPMAAAPSTAKPSPAKAASGPRGVSASSARYPQGVYLSLSGGTWRQSN